MPHSTRQLKAFNLVWSSTLSRCLGKDSYNSNKIYRRLKSMLKKSRIFATKILSLSYPYSKALPCKLWGSWEGRGKVQK